MKISSNLIELDRRISANIADYFSAHRPANSTLLLDSTGPSFTRQYIVLNKIGLDRLFSFKEIHAFSGAVYALFGYIAFMTEKNVVSIDALCQPDAERVFRDQHHPGLLSGLRAVSKMLVGRPAFGSVAPLIASLEYIFGDFVNQPFSAFPDNIYIYLAKSKEAPLLVLSNNERCTPELQPLRQAPIKHIIAMSANVPMLYGGSQANVPYFDPVYTKQYVATLKKIGAAENPLLVSTPWRSGQKDNRYYLNCYPQGNPRWLMLGDLARLVGAQKNVCWSRDIYTAFRHAAQVQAQA
jgi:hypothetical protein